MEEFSPDNHAYSSDRSPHSTKSSRAMRMHSAVVIMCFGNMHHQTSIFLLGHHASADFLISNRHSLQENALLPFLSVHCIYTLHGAVVLLPYARNVMERFTRVPVHNYSFVLEHCTSRYHRHRSCHDKEYRQLFTTEYLYLSSRTFQGNCPMI